MDNCKIKKWQIICGYFLFGVILVFFLTMNFVTPVIGEDYVLVAYSPFFPPESSSVLIENVLSRILYQMQTWNVRLGEQFSIIFSCMDCGLFHILNSLAAIYYIWLVLLYAHRGHCKISESIWCVFIAFSTILLFQPAIGEVFFWRTGSSNYLWALIILLTFAYPVCCLFLDNHNIIETSIIKTVFLTILGFFAGFTNENTVVTVWILYIIVIIVRNVRRINRPVWLYTSFVSFTIGFVFMLKAPSTSIRIAYYNQLFGTQYIGLFGYLRRIPIVTLRFFTDNSTLIIITVICLMIAFICYRTKLRRNNSTEKLSIAPVVLLLLSSVSCAALVMSPYIETRSFFLPDFLMTVCVAYYSEYLVYAFKQKKGLLITLIIVFLFLDFFYMIQFYRVYKSYYGFCEQRTAEISISDEPFFWREYPGPYSNRILTTREDYCIDNQKALTSYYGKPIKTIPGYVGNQKYLQIINYQHCDALGGIDWLEYNDSDKTLTVVGWGTINDTCSKDNEIYIFLDNGIEKKFFKTLYAQARPDVAAALNDNHHSNSGFKLDTVLLDEMISQPENIIGFCVINRDKKVYGEVKCKSIIIENYEGINDD